MNELVGIHWLLAETPIWLIALLLYLCTDGAIHLLRDKLEGLGYQTAFSAKFGDAGLMAAILIAATIIQRGDVYLPSSLLLIKTGWFQTYLLTACVAIGMGISKVTNGMRSGQAADTYHDVVIGPAILFLAITVGPIIAFNARWYELAFVSIAVLVWLALIYIDLKYERFNQRQWLVRNGFAIKGEIPKW